MTASASVRRPAEPGRRLRLPRPGDALLRRLAFATAVALAAIVVTGGVVRLTSSGLGCPTWPRCSASSFVSSSTGMHSAVEFGNRVVSFAVGALLAATCGAVWLRRRDRPDLRWLAAGLLAGYVGEAVLGGLTVLFALSPVLVAAHFLLSMLLLWDAVALYFRAAAPPGRSRPVVGGDARWLAWAIVTVTGLVLVLGTVVTGSGPHSGGGHHARLGFPLERVAQLHSDAVLLLVGLTVAAVVVLRHGAAPRELQSRAWLVLGLELAQGLVGYVQFFTGLPAALIGVHIAGATALWAAALSLALSTATRQSLPVPLPPQPLESVRA